MTNRLKEIRDKYETCLNAYQMQEEARFPSDKAKALKVIEDIKAVMPASEWEHNGFPAEIISEIKDADNYYIFHTIKMKASLGGGSISSVVYGTALEKLLDEFLKVSDDDHNICNDIRNADITDYLTSLSGESTDTSADL